MKKGLLVLILLFIFLSEIGLKINVTLGFVFYIALITGVLLSLHKVESLDNYGKLAVIFLILPMIRIAEFFMNFDYFWKNLIVYYILLFLVCFYSFKFKINPGYNKKYLVLLPLAILLGISLGFLGNSLFSFEKDIKILILVPVIAYSEEVLFRGLIQNLIKKEYSWVIAVLITAIIYGIFSLSFGFNFLVFIFLVNLIISLIYNFAGNIFLTITINIILQTFLFILPKIHLV